jgi:hypothetical protein
MKIRFKFVLFIKYSYGNQIKENEWACHEEHMWDVRYKKCKQNSSSGVPKVCAEAPWGAARRPSFLFLRNLNLLRHSLNIVTRDQFPVTRSLS